MFDFIWDALERRSSTQVVVLALTAVGLIGTLDHLTGYQLSFSIFYLIPIALVTWYANRWAGFALCGVSSVTWLAVEYTSGNSYGHWTIPLWNATVRLLFFLLTAYLLNELRVRLIREKLLARTDDLTQVMNARAFKDVTSRLLQQARRHNHSTALGFIDLDNFKAVNDRLGHSEGDRVLKTLAATLSRCVRAGDVVGRLGGDEFAIFMAEINDIDTRISFDRIHEELVREASAHGWPVGFSVGVALFPNAPSTIDEAVKIADRLMYRVKNNGKNSVIYEELTPADITVAQVVPEDVA